MAVHPKRVGGTEQAGQKLAVWRGGFGLVFGQVTQLLALDPPPISLYAVRFGDEPRRPLPRRPVALVLGHLGHPGGYHQRGDRRRDHQDPDCRR